MKEIEKKSLLIFFLFFSFTDEVMTKFGNLRTVYQRQSKLYQRQPSGSAGLGFTPTYKHFFALQFLSDNVQPTASVSNLSTYDEDTTENTDDPNETAADPNETAADDDAIISDSVSL